MEEGPTEEAPDTQNPEQYLQARIIRPAFVLTVSGPVADITAESMKANVCEQFGISPDGVDVRDNGLHTFTITFIGRKPNNE